MLNGKKILFATGGTGGHINPALAVAGYIRENYPKAEILFVGTADRMEAQLVPAAGYDFKTIEIQGFSRELNFEGLKHNIKTVNLLFKSEGQAKKIIEDFKPDVVIGFGGYVSGPVLSVAARMGIPTAVHEQNAFPGVTNKNLAKKVDVVMLTAPEAEKLLKPKNPCVVTGLPIRGEIISANKEFARAEMKLDSHPLILSMGGSLGARAINEAVKYLILHRFEKKDCYYLHATGKAGASMIDDIGKDVDLNANPQIMLREYINDMDRCLAAADLVVCRAGASSLSEIQALGKPSILVPYPYAAENHQYYNAKTMSDRDAAILIEEKDFTGERLLSEVEKLFSKPERLKKMGENARAMAILDASQRITECVCKIVKN
ncbi:uDP-N-acetylglucosamine--N-acetylmuramyl-(pentapeptide) pyrophosphoryl-undecaprenol N-acetylglucosamine transferase [Ruminococcus sp. CAG:488]|nr:uDP-N-acetylglucosamine--N-acetylmuramyl-(pentapeptide) pyrophosphoryl-undecaprenol N-acetylglucosamine transferase [Ruminococcus sp. CAG:488]